jgi:hypothetical protein
MPKYNFNFWEESKWNITFEADSIEHARKLLDEAHSIADVDTLPEVERFFKKGDETWDYETLAEVED